MGKKGDKNRLKIKCLWEYFYTRGKFSDNSKRKKGSYMVVIDILRGSPKLVFLLPSFDPLLIIL